MADRFAAADPKLRVKWVGPDMSVRSSISARLMETWAHAQAVYDVLGKQRDATDRLKNVAVIGINTFGWTFFATGVCPFPAIRPMSGSAPRRARCGSGTRPRTRTRSGDRRLSSARS